VIGAAGVALAQPLLHHLIGCAKIRRRGGLFVIIGRMYWQTSWPADHRPWIAPDLYAPPTFEAYRRNRDPAMEAIPLSG